MATCVPQAHLDLSVPRVSVIMAAYNAEAFIAEAVESVLAQTFTDWELLISDDGSTDGTHELAQTLAAHNPERIRVLRGEQNRGKPAALNRALAVRRGELIAWLDGDDVMLPEKLARQVEALDQDPLAAGCTHDAEMFDSDSGRVIGSFSQVANGGPLRSGGVELWFDPTYKMLPSATMIRSSLCPDHGFEDRLTFTNDWLFDIEVFRAGRCIALAETLVRYRRHSDNFTTRAAASGASYEEGLMTMAIVMARYPELQRRARTMSAAILLGQARRGLAERRWREAAHNGAAAWGTGGIAGLAGIAAAMAGAHGRRPRRPARASR
jgi:glycosyltransferase involved in cell wall biosynthesis